MAKGHWLSGASLEEPALDGVTVVWLIVHAGWWQQWPREGEQLQLSSLSLSHTLSGLRIGASPVGREAFTLILEVSVTLGHLDCKPGPA